MISEWLDKAKNGESVWLCDVKNACAEDPGCRKVLLSVVSVNGERLDQVVNVPRWENGEERKFAEEYLCACLFNTLSARGGRQVTLYAGEDDAELFGLLAGLRDIFQLDSPVRSGLGKCISVSERMCRALGARFSFAVKPLGEYTPAAAAETEKTGLSKMLRETAKEAETLCLCGIDVGGTDIKLAVSAGGKLAAVKEYDWNPALFREARELIDPMLLLIRLMRCAAAANNRELSRSAQSALKKALEKDASEAQMLAAVELCEQELGENINVLDGIGVSFPDVVLRNAIVGGETPKTDGIRKNAALDYETEFGKLTALKESLLPLCRENGRVRLTNDGNMAAYTAAMELAHGEDPSVVDGGVFAHTMGTDLGSGWIGGDGMIPELPLELYDLLIDLGSYKKRALDDRDLRCTRNGNSGLCGARRYMGQSAAFRLAWERKPSLLDGFVTEKDGILDILSEPSDLRKPCLEHLMQQACAGDEAACEVFRLIGENLGRLSLEAEELLEIGTKKRFIFGRFVKTSRCFELIRQGCAGVFPALEPEAANEDMAFTPLMKDLASRGDVTVAQFGQAVGAAYFALS